jgi:photosystem II stability/assembly factor-like uncharacterized protein
VKEGANMKRSISLLYLIKLASLLIFSICFEIGSLHAYGSSTDSISISVGKGWNLVSLPFVVSDPRPSSVFPTAVSSAFFYDSGYQVADTLEPGHAYWLKFDSAMTVTFVGSPFTEYSVQLHPGWNLVGSTSQPISLDRLDYDPCTAGFVGHCFGFAPGSGYVETDTIQPAHGAWIMVTEAGTLYEKHWTKVTDLPISTIWTHPTDPSIIWGAISSDFSEGTIGAVVKSSNGGATWDTILAGVDAGGGIAEPGNPNVMYVGMGGVNTCTPGIVKTTDGGNSWFRADLGIAQDLDCDSWAHVNLIDPNNTNVLYATAGGVVSPSRFYKSTDGGSHWSFVLIPEAINCALGTFAQSFPLTPAIDPQNSNVLYAGTQLDTIFYWSTDGGQSWDIRHCFFGGHDILTVHVDPTDSNTLFVAAYGFYRSTDRGVSWEALNNGLDVSQGLEFAPTSDPEIFYAMTPGCVYRTENKGLTWTLVKCDPLDQIFERLDQAGKFIYTSDSGGVYRMRICTTATN